MLYHCCIESCQVKGIVDRFDPGKVRALAFAAGPPPPGPLRGMPPPPHMMGGPRPLPGGPRGRPPFPDDWCALAPALAGLRAQRAVYGSSR